MKDRAFIAFKRRYESKYRNRRIILFIISAMFLYLIFFPKYSGMIGSWVENVFFKKFGNIPSALFFFIAIYLSLTRKKNIFPLLFANLLFVISIATLMSFFKIGHGGDIGIYLKENFFLFFGPHFAPIIFVVLSIYLSSVIFNYSLPNLVESLIEYVSKKIKEDIEIWKKEVSKQKKTPRILKPEKIEKPKQKIKITPIKKYQLPPVELLSQKSDISEKYNQEEIKLKSKLLIETLREFGIEAKIAEILPGPVVSRYELVLEPGTRLQTITSLSKEISLALKAPSVRIIAPIPGKDRIGIELPNPKSRIVEIREILSSEKFKKKTSKLTFALGKTIEGKPYYSDLLPMPHLLIAGATGTGKSVCIHCLIISLLYKNSPEELKLLLIDPKRLELPIYNGIPHLYDPCVEPKDVKVITNPNHASKALRGLVEIMDNRYKKYAKVMARNIESYNEIVGREGRGDTYIVVIIDEFADLMISLPKEVEESIQRLSQMARAVGIHLVIATQRPSVDVITGVIKANFSSRIAFQVLSKTDSRVILDTGGAENLLGRGDMLFLPTGALKPIRIQGAYISERDVNKVVSYIKSQGYSPSYTEYVVTKIDEKEVRIKQDLRKALKLISERKRVSQDLLKAHFGSSAKATDILSILEIKGFIYKPEGSNKWKINFEKVEGYLHETH